MSQDQAQTAPLARAPAREPGALAPMREPGQIATLSRDAAEPPAEGAPPAAPRPRALAAAFRPAARRLGRARLRRLLGLRLVRRGALPRLHRRRLCRRRQRRSSPPRSPATSSRSRSPTNQKVHAGDLLARIDDGDYRLAVDAAKAKIATQDATIARIGRQIEAQDAAIDQAAAQVASTDAQAEGAVADEKRAALEFDRSQKLADANFGSQQRLEQATADRARAAATLAAALAAKTGGRGRARRRQGRRRSAQGASRPKPSACAANSSPPRPRPSATSPSPKSARRSTASSATRRRWSANTRSRARVCWRSCRCRAAYVDANFKETQLDGDPPRAEGRRRRRFVRRARRVPGVVESVSPASGAQFSLLPPDNATGNFTKVVQRVTVRIAIAPEALAREPLRAGLSVVATIHTRDESQPRADPARPVRPRRRGRRDGAPRSERRRRARRAGRAEPHFEPRRLFAFIFMVFGMFMAILDIQIVSASLQQIQAGLSASSDEVTWVQTAYLIAEVIMIPLSGYPVARLLDPLRLRRLGRRLHLDELLLLARDDDRRDDLVARGAGLHRRRHDPDRLRHRLHDLPAQQAADRRAGHRPGRDAGADDRPDGRAAC